MTCGFALRNLVDLPPFFAELARVVRPGGRIALLDVGVPRNRIVRSRARAVLRQGGAEDRRLAVRSSRLPLPATQRRLPASTGAAGRLAAQRGFGDAAQQRLTLGVTQLFTGTRDR